jgi:hypothetical protein
VAFVGAGFTKAVQMPLWAELLEKLASDVERMAPHASVRRDLLSYAQACISNREFARAASAIRRAAPPHFVDSRLEVYFDGKKQFLDRPSTDPAKVEMSHRLDALLDLPWAGIVTTNYDNIIATHLTRTRRPWTNICHRPSDNLGQALKSSKRPFLIHLHGNVDNGQMILTEEDYDDVYLASSVVLSFLRALLLRYTLVFIGTQVEDRFIELKRELQIVFKDKATGVSRPPLSPEYVLLARNDEYRGAYLEHTGGFNIVWYSNETSTHEGLVPSLRSMADALASIEGYEAVNDEVSRLLLGIVKQSKDRGITLGQITKKFWPKWAMRPVNLPELNNRELKYRLYFLVYKKYIQYDERYKVFRPL